MLRLLCLCLCLLCSSLCAAEEAKIYGATPPSTFTLYALDPELVGSWNTPLRDYEKRYIPERYWNLPLLGGWYGQGFIPDKESLLASGLKKAFVLGVSGRPIAAAEKTLKELGMEVHVISGGRIAEIGPCFAELGKVFQREARGQALAKYAEETLGRIKEAMKDFPKEKRVRAYLALGPDGFSSICHGSANEEALLFSGAESVLQCPRATKNARLHINFEQLASYDPDVILVFHPRVMTNMTQNPQWQHLRAVREKKVYFLPRGPFSWFERPASYMRLLGIQWLSNILHPDRYSIDIKAEAKKFMQLFFHLDLTDQEIETFFVPYGSF